MSVALIYRPRGALPEQAEMVPVATEEVFREHWLPGARALGLVWVPMFETGVKVSEGDLQAVLEELRALERWLIANTPESATLVQPRIARLVDVLEHLPPLQDGQAFIG